MKKFATILSVAVLALGFLGADAEERCPTIVQGFSRELFVVEQNLPQDYCAQFRKGGDREFELAQANGTQILTGACSNTPQGEIPTVDHMPSTLIHYPRNGQKIKKNKPFDVKFEMRNMELGFFSDPVITYNGFPQELNEKGFIKGHSHVTVQFLGKNKERITKTDEFAFFKGVNGPADKDGFSTVKLELGLPKKGIYRICTMGSSFAHSCYILPKAQRGFSDDCIRIRVY